MSKIYLYCKCEICDGKGEIQLDVEFNGIESDMVQICNQCENGKTVMEFEYEDSDAICIRYDQVGGDNILTLYIPRFKCILYDSGGEAVSNFNPFYLEIIEEQECPECKGKNQVKYYYGKSSTMPKGSFRYVSCENCFGGKIEVVTFTGFFGDMKEYDEKIRKSGYNEGVAWTKLRENE